MDRAAAAAILGVHVDSDPAAVRRAYRMWARMMHPDAGGDPAHFAQLTQARQVLLRTRVGRRIPTSTAGPVPRPPLSAMVRLPKVWPILTLAAIALPALALLPKIGLSVPVATFVAGVCAAGWSVATVRTALRAGADAGHRIAMLTLTWLPAAAAITLVSLIAKTGFITMLPLLALPFVAVIAVQNAGAGLWRPVGRHTTPDRTDRSSRG